MYIGIRCIGNVYKSCPNSASEITSICFRCRYALFSNKGNIRKIIKRIINSFLLHLLMIAMINGVIRYSINIQEQYHPAEFKIPQSLNESVCSIVAAFKN